VCGGLSELFEGKSVPDSMETGGLFLTPPIILLVSLEVLLSLCARFCSFPDFFAHILLFVLVCIFVAVEVVWYFSFFW
jgi:hypothetical protein